MEARKKYWPGMSKRKSKRPLEKHEKLHTRTLLMSFTLVILFSLLSGRLIYLQAVKHEEFKTLVEKQHIQKITLTSQRGAILDRNGELLACNQTVYSMFADRNHILKDLGIACRGLAYAEGLPTRNLVRTYSSAEIRQRYLERVADVLSPKLGQPKWEIVRNLQKSKKVEVLLEPDLEQDWTREMKEHLNQERIRGVYFREKMRRFLPESASFDPGSRCGEQ